MPQSSSPAHAESNEFGRDGRRSERKLDFEGAAFSQIARDFDVAEVFLHDAADEREAESGAVAPGGVEGAKNLGNLLVRHSTAGVRDGDNGATLLLN